MSVVSRIPSWSDIAGGMDSTKEGGRALLKVICDRKVNLLHLQTPAVGGDPVPVSPQSVLLVSARVSDREVWTKNTF